MTWKSFAKHRKHHIECACEICDPRNHVAVCGDEHVNSQDGLVSVCVLARGHITPYHQHPADNYVWSADHEELRR